MLRPGQSTPPAPPPPPPPPSSSSSSSTPPAPLELPSTDHDDVIDAERAFEAARAAAAAAGAGCPASGRSSSDAAAAASDADDEAFQLVWALVHSSWQSDARRGRELAAALQAKAAAATGGGAGGGGERARELAYLEAVGAWKTGDLVVARRLLAGILASTPASRQASALKAAVDDQIVRDGLVGIGIGAAAVAAIGCVLAMAFGGRSRR